MGDIEYHLRLSRGNEMGDPLFENVLSLWRSTYEVYTALKSKLQENQRVGL